MPWGFFGGKMLEKRPDWAERIRSILRGQPNNILNMALKFAIYLTGSHHSRLE